MREVVFTNQRERIDMETVAIHTPHTISTSNEITLAMIGLAYKKIMASCTRINNFDYEI